MDFLVSSRTLWILSITFFITFIYEVSSTRIKRQSVPNFTQSNYILSPLHCQPGTTIGSVSATDAVRYTLASSSTNLAINPNTGQLITINRLQDSSPFSITVQATNSAGQSSSSQVTVIPTCQDGSGLPPVSSPVAPVFTQNGNYIFRISSCVGPVTIGTISASKAVSYSLIVAGGLTMFSVNPSSGVLSLAGSVPADTYVIPVQATSASGATTRGSVQVTVTCGFDGNLQFQQNPYMFSPLTCDPISTVIGNINLAGRTACSGEIYSIQGGSSGNYRIDNCGRITSIGFPQRANITVQAVFNGQTATASVIVTPNCAGATGGGQVTNFIVANGCMVGVDNFVGQLVSGAVEGTAMYSLDATGLNNFQVDPATGSLFYQRSLPENCYSFNAVIVNADGRTVTLPIRVQCGLSASCGFEPGVLRNRVG